MSSGYSETLRVRFRDTDSNGHMFFANYLVLGDEVAGNYMHELGFDWSDPDSMPCLVFMANASCDYLHECYAGDEVRIEVGYQRIGNTSATLGFTASRISDGIALATGSFVQVFVDRESRKPTPIPASLRAVLDAATPAAASSD